MPLSDKERAEFEAKLKADDEERAAANAPEPEHYYRLMNPSGSSFEVLAGTQAGKKTHAWVKSEFGVDLDEEPVQDEPKDEPEEKARRPRAVKDGEKGAFGTRVAGRRVG